MHYISSARIPSQGDVSGVSVRYTELRPLRSVGIISLHVHGILKPKSDSFWDAACQFDLLPNQKLYPFGFLSHTHKHGVHVSGWVVKNNNLWTSIGMKNPQEPQSFYPVESEGVTISTEDVVATRCILHSGKCFRE